MSDRLLNGVPELLAQSWWPLRKTATWALIRDRKLPARKFGRRVLISEADARALLDSLPPAREAA
jgi:hypothetical protein